MHRSGRAPLQSSNKLKTEDMSYPRVVSKITTINTPPPESEPGAATPRKRVRAKFTVSDRPPVRYRGESRYTVVEYSFFASYPFF